jgi:hypothetical protein
MAVVSSRTIQAFIDNAKSLNHEENIQLFKLITHNNIEYSENQNGIFVDLSKITRTKLKPLNDFVKLCILNHKSQDERNKQYEEAKRKVELKSSKVTSIENK